MTTETKITPIYLSPEEAHLFVQFQKRFCFMQLLESVGAFNLKNASIEIHFDNLGGIAKVDKHEHYKVVE